MWRISLNKLGLSWAKLSKRLASQASWCLLPVRPSSCLFVVSSSCKVKFLWYIFPVRLSSWMFVFLWVQIHVMSFSHEFVFLWVLFWPTISFIFIFIFFILSFCYGEWSLITDHRTDTHVPGTNGHNSMGCKTLTTPRASFITGCR